MIRHATAVWYGPGKDGKGTITSQSTVLNETQYSFLSRFEDGIGTNPEELIAAAHAGCFTMKLSINLANAGFSPEVLTTKCNIKFENLTLTESKLILKAKVPNIDEAKFAELVKDAELNCPISKVLNTKISVEYTLE